MPPGNFLGNHCDYFGSPSDCIYLIIQLVTGFTHLTVLNLVKLTPFSFHYHPIEWDAGSILI